MTTRRTLTIKKPRTLSAPTVPYNPSIPLPAARAFMQFCAVAQDINSDIGPALERLNSSRTRLLPAPPTPPTAKEIRFNNARVLESMAAPTPADADALLLITQAQLDQLFAIQSKLDYSQHSIAPDAASTALDAAVMIMELITQIKNQN